MKFREIRVGELDDLIASGWYRRQKIIPITPSRAISQAINPNAYPNDIALLMAVAEDDSLAGFAGILPARLYLARAEPERFFYNSCWWIYPDKGRRVSMPLFYRMLEITRGRMVLADMTEHTEKIVDGTGRFRVQKPAEGIYLWFRGGAGTFLSRKSGYRPWVKLLASPVDLAINGMQYLRLQGMQIAAGSDTFTVRPASVEQQDVNEFIDRMCAGNPLTRRASDLKWILRTPWLIPCKLCKKGTHQYPFSWKVESFVQHVLRIDHNQLLVGVAVVNFRDGIAKVPYLYVLQGSEEPVAQALLFWMLRQPAHGLLTWNQYLLRELKRLNLPAVIKRKVYKRTAYNLVLSEVLDTSFELQDGDGDSVFT